MPNSLLTRVLTDQTGATALEYGFLVAFVAAVLINGVLALAEAVAGLFSHVSSNVTDKVGK